MRSITFLILLLSYCAGRLQAKKSDTTGLYQFTLTEKKLATSSLDMIAGETDSIRASAAWNLYHSLDTLLHMPLAKNYPFDTLRHATVSIIALPDRSFRIFTFNLITLAGDFKQFGFIEVRGKKETEIFPLLDTAKKPKKDFLETELETGEWIGALYYGIAPCGKGKKKYYILMGFDGSTAHSNKKIMDVLWFDNGVPVFGKPVFLEGSQDIKPSYRVVYEFHNESLMLLRYEEKRKIIVLDDMAPAFPEAVNDFYYYIPSGDYDYYALNKKGFWVRENLEDLDLGQGVKPRGPTERPKPEPAPEKQKD